MAIIFNFLIVAGSDAGAKYYGGELRHECGGKQAVVIVAAETSGLANPREAVACRLLQKILGENLMLPSRSIVLALQKV